MATPCGQIGLFVDGELEPAQAEGFRQHLLDCARCQGELGHLLQLKQLAVRYVAQEPVQALPRRRAASPWRGAAAALVGVGALAAVVVLLLVLRRAPAQEDPWLLAEPRRRVEVRLASAALDRHRPLAARSMGGAGAERLPLEALTRLEREGDMRGLAAAFLLRQDRALVDQALVHLEPLEGTPEVETERAAALLLKEEPEQALRHVERALEQAPRLAQALWNRGLALRGLELPLTAARSFREVARLQEPGWAAEALQRAEQLEQAEQARTQRWQAVLQAGEQLASSGTPPPAAVLADRPPMLRLFFYDAVRSRTSKEQVLALLPLARELDSQVGGEVLTRYVTRVAARDFARRAPLAQAYEQLRQGRLPPERTQALVAALLRSGEDDLLLGALVQAEAVAEHLEAFEARAQALEDPWFRLLAAQERAQALLRRGEAREARRTLEQALALCALAPLEYRCMGLELDLAEANTLLSRLEEAWEHAARGWRKARAANERGKELLALGHLAQLARLRKDLPLARAYLEESLERNRGNAQQERYAWQNLAHLALQVLRWDKAREYIDKALATGLPLTHVGAMALSDIARQRPAPGDEAALSQALAAASASATAGQRALLRHAQGRLALERNRPQGRALLEEVLREVEAPGLLDKDEDARRARAYSYTSLILDSGKAGEYAAALELWGRELGGTLPERCVLAATSDSERSLWVARGDAGQLLGSYEGVRTVPLPEDLSGLVPSPLLEALRRCEQVEVFARPPLQGRPGLLPVELAWRYRLRAGAPPRPLVGKAVHLVVKDVALSAQRERQLGRLNPWEAGFGESEERRVLAGLEATPSRVLAAMRDATEIDLVTHGVISPSSEGAYLVLAEEGGEDELSASRLKEQRLEGAPLVVLAACRAARAAVVLHAPTSLPAALLQAGARGVVASTVEIPDLEAAAFFNAMRERIRQGAPPAVALRDERLQWLARQKGRNWLHGVLIFD